MIKGFKIGVVIPCYRVKNHIAGTVGDIPAFVDAIIVVNDCCPHGSGDAIALLRDPRITVITHAINQGVGGAMISGFKECLRLNIDIIIKMDGDGQMAGSDIKELIRPLLEEKADYTKGNRWVMTAALSSMPLLRRIGNTGLSFMAKVSSGYWNVFDPNNGFIAISRHALALLELDKLERRYFFENSMLINLNIIRAVVRDVPLPARYGTEVSSLSVSRTLVEFPIRMLVGFCRRIWWRHFVFDFSLFAIYLAIGIILTSFGLVFGGISWTHSLMTGISATAGTVMLATFPTLVGIQLLLQAILLDVTGVPTVPIGLEEARKSDSTQVIRNAASQSIKEDFAIASSDD